MLMIQTELYLLKLAVEVMIVIVVKNPVMSLESRQLKTGTQIGLVTRSSLNTNASIKTEVRSLNTQRRKVFHVVCEWARKKVIYKDSNESQNPKPSNYWWSRHGKST